MGFFTDGYNQGEAIQFNKCSADEHEKILKDILGRGTYNEIVEWYNGFYKAMLDIDLKKVETAFSNLKKQGEKNH